MNSLVDSTNRPIAHPSQLIIEVARRTTSIMCLNGKRDETTGRVTIY